MSHLSSRKKCWIPAPTATEVLKWHNSNSSFQTIYTASYKDPIFNGVYQRDWIDHVMYTRNDSGFKLTTGCVNWMMPDGQPIWKKYKNASDQAPVTAVLTV